jgi:hypothetical protein
MKKKNPIYDIVDGHEPFARGHLIGCVRTFRHRLPEWANSHEHVNEFLRKRFPRANEPCLLSLDTDRHRCNCAPCRHHSKAGLWMFLIIRYFRQGLRAKTCMLDWNEWKEELGCKFYELTVRRVEKEIEMIKLAHAGRRLDRKPRTTGKAGRPSLPRAQLVRSP